MSEHLPAHDEAMALLGEYTGSDSLLKHAYAVEGVMRYLAQKLGERCR